MSASKDGGSPPNDRCVQSRPCCMPRPDWSPNCTVRAWNTACVSTSTCSASRSNSRDPRNASPTSSEKGAQVMLEEPLGRTFLAADLEHPYGRGVNFQIQVDDVLRLYSSVRASGIPVPLELEDRWYRDDERAFGNRQFVVQDPERLNGLRFFQGSWLARGTMTSDISQLPSPTWQFLDHDPPAGRRSQNVKGRRGLPVHRRRGPAARSTRPGRPAAERQRAADHHQRWQTHRREGEQQHAGRTGAHPEAEHGLNNRNLAGGGNDEQRPSNRQTDHDRQAVAQVGSSRREQESAGESPAARR